MSSSCGHSYEVTGTVLVLDSTGNKCRTGCCVAVSGLLVPFWYWIAPAINIELAAVWLSAVCCMLCGEELEIQSEHIRRSVAR